MNKNKQLHAQLFSIFLLVASWVWELAVPQITSDSMDYDAKNSKAIYRNQGQVESIVSDEKITSKVGYFFPKTGSFFFSQKVAYRKKDLTMTTDTLQFSYEKQTVYFFGPTKVINDSITIFCKNGWYHVNKNEATLYNKAEIIQKTNIIRGDTIYYNNPNIEIISL